MNELLVLAGDLSKISWFIKAGSRVGPAFFIYSPFNFSNGNPHPSGICHIKQLGETYLGGGSPIHY